MTRQDIIDLIGGLRDDPSVYAMWLEGADAHGLADEYSDVDVWLDVEDGYAESVLGSIRAILTEFGPLDLDMEGSNPHPQIRQAFFHVKGTPEFMVLDLCIQDHSRDIAFRNGFADEKIKVIFDKSGVIRHEDVNWQAFRLDLSRRTAELRRAFPLGRIGVRKGIGRGHFLEALSYYHTMLESLVGLLRIEHQPTKHEFGLKHIERDLPAELVVKLQDLYAVSSLEDLESKWPLAEEVFHTISADPLRE